MNIYVIKEDLTCKRVRVEGECPLWRYSLRK